MAAASSSLFCPCSSASSSATCGTISAASPRSHERAARRARSKLGHAPDAFGSALNSASNSCSFQPVSPINSTSRHGQGHAHGQGQGRGQQQQQQRRVPQAIVDARSRRSSVSSSDGIPVNCVCCTGLVSQYRSGQDRHLRGRRGRPGSSSRGVDSGSSGSCSTTTSRGSSRAFSLQTLIPFPIAGNRGMKKKGGSMEAGTSVGAAATTTAAPTVKPRSRLNPGDPLPDDYTEDDPSKTAPERRAGILLHPTSLPGSYGIGELGDEALHFLDWLKGAGCTVWQVLPLVPPGRKSGEDGSPYAGQDANCGNTLLVSLEELVKWGLLEKSDLPRRLPVNRVDYDAVAKVKDPLLVKAAQKLLATEGGLFQELLKFRKSPNISAWLEEAALFSAIDSSIDAQFWWKWPAPLRDREPKALEAARKQHKQYIDEFVAQQFLFQRQWQAVHKYAREQGIRIIGDMPIYVGGHSADVWANRSSFMLDGKTGVPVMVSGVPPDAFSATGQLWGSPLYNWKAMAKDNYSWWATRMKRAFELYDEFRIDHFRGLAGYWAVDADEETALNGSWQVGPRMAFFDAIQKAVGKIDIIAEDLGVITSDVVELRKGIKAPGMAVLQFAFGSDPGNPHLPHNHEIEQVVYPGTHDNDTVKGWWVKLPEDEKETVRAYLKLKGTGDDISWDFIRASFSSVARTAIIPMQDVLSLDNSARMNTPAVQAGNWGWRVGESGVFTKLDKERDQLRALLKYYNRMPRRIYCPI